ncbi:MAG: hypothetical protein KJO98_11070 [Rhodothermia bacterium]|nr:hypothetical protein [Rhodothermia bacterium]
MTERRFEIPRRFDPTRSVFGRFVGRHADVLQSEARYYFATIMMLIGILIANFIAWAILKPTIMDDPLGTVAILYWAVQVVSMVGFLALCLVGFQRGTVITVDDCNVSLARGDEPVTVRRSDIDSLEIVSALAFHRHYRRYSNVSSYAAVGTEAYVIIRVSEKVLAIGLGGENAQDLLNTLKSGAVTREEAVRVAL